MVWLLVRMNHHYARERVDLDEGLSPFEHQDLRRPIVVLLVENLDRKTIHALQYAKTIRPIATQAVHSDGHDRISNDVLQRWDALGIDVPLRMLRHDGDPASSIAGYAAALAGEADVTVVVPGPARVGFFERLRRGRIGGRPARALAPYPNVRVTLVRDHDGPGHASATGSGTGPLRVLPRGHHRAVVPVDKADRAALRAVRYALTLGVEEVVAIHAAVDPDLQEELIDRWMELRIPVPLELVECWDRDVARSLERRVTELMEGRSEVTVVLPRRDHATLRQRLLHDRTSRRIVQTLGRHEHVDITVVPFYFEARQRGRRTSAATPPRAR